MEFWDQVSFIGKCRQYSTLTIQNEAAMPLLIQLLLLLFPMVIGKVRGRPASRDFSKPSTVQEVTFVLPQAFIQVLGHRYLPL